MHSLSVVQALLQQMKHWLSQQPKHEALNILIQMLQKSQWSILQENTLSEVQDLMFVQTLLKPDNSYYFITSVYAQ